MNKTTPFVFGASLLAGVAMSAQAGTLSAKSTGGIQTGTGVTALAIQAGAGLNFDTASQNDLNVKPVAAYEKGLVQSEEQGGKPNSKSGTQGSANSRVKTEKDAASHKHADQAQKQGQNLAANATVDAKASGTVKAGAE